MNRKDERPTSPGRGRSTAKLRHPCSNCPWRVDAPREHWDPQHFVEIWRNCQDDGLHVMLCHKSNALPVAEQGNVPCQGWIRVMGRDAIGVRILLMNGKITFEEVEDRGGPALFPTFAAMLKANKIRLPKRSTAVKAVEAAKRSRT
jgi:hypothetical protein